MTVPIVVALTLHTVGVMPPLHVPDGRPAIQVRLDRPAPPAPCVTFTWKF